MTNKYAIIMLCIDTDDEIYTDFVNMLFNSREDAEEEMQRCLKGEYESLVENESDWRTYSYDNDTVYVSGRILTRYSIIEITNEKEKKETPSKNEVFSESFPYVSSAMYEDALCAFRHLFGIDDNDEEYACGSLEKLAIIIGKDYRYSDLLFEVAQDIINNADTRFGIHCNDWEDSIKRIVGEDKYDMAFEEWHPDIPEINVVIHDYQEDLDFSNRDIEYIETNEKLMAAIFFAIVEYLDEEEVLWADINMSKNSTDDCLFDVLNIIRETYRKF